VPLTAAQLGEFLYRVAAVRDRLQYDAYTPAGVIPLDATVRTYPSGGALYPLEIYPVVQACAGLDSGLYHYDPGGHRLERLTPDQRFVQGLIEHAAAAAGLSGSAVQILLVITARFQRVAWKYESLAYSLILKDLGGLMQSMYLAATAMGLAPCALGAGDSDLFAQAAGIDYYAEGSVGEFLLGSRAG
jgi:SagB-type dehydrogenase family enzyme